MAFLKLNDVMDRLLLLIRSGYPVIYLETHEEARVLDNIAKLVRVIKAENRAKNLFRWYDKLGLQALGNLPALNIGPQTTASATYDWLSIDGNPNGSEWLPVAGAHMQSASGVLDTIRRADANDNNLRDSVIVFHDLHPYLRSDSSNSQVRQLRNTADALRRYYEKNQTTTHFYRTLIIVAPSTNGLSLELSLDVLAQEFPLPEISELRLSLINMLLNEDAQRLLERIEQRKTPEARQRVGDLVVTGVGALRFTDTQAAEYASPEEVIDARVQLCDLIAGAGRGLTLENFKLGLNMFRVQGGYIAAKHIEDMLYLKAQSISNEALRYTPRVDIQLGGLDSVIEWIRLRKGAATSESLRAEYHLPPPKGVMLCGASGGGKSQLAKLFAKEFDLALLRLDIGALFGSYVGESEQRTRHALQLAEVLAPVVLWIDEADKAFAGIGSTAGDNGVSARVFGHFLTWLSEKADNVFVVLTANNFHKLLDPFPEFGRKGRFDAIMWVPVPKPEARQKIFGIYLEKHVDSILKLNDESEDEIFKAANDYQLVDQPEGNTPFEKLTHLLSQNEISQAMTGAEIEHAINEALFINYQHHTGNEPYSGLTPDLIIEAVKRGSESALYSANSPDRLIYDIWEQEAIDKGWPFAE